MTSEQTVDKEFDWQVFWKERRIADFRDASSNLGRYIDELPPISGGNTLRGNQSWRSTRAEEIIMNRSKSLYAVFPFNTNRDMTSVKDFLWKLRWYGIETKSQFQELFNRQIASVVGTEEDTLTLAGLLKDFIVTEREAYPSEESKEPWVVSKQEVEEKRITEAEVVTQEIPPVKRMNAYQQFEKWLESLPDRRGKTPLEMSSWVFEREYWIGYDGTGSIATLFPEMVDKQTGQIASLIQFLRDWGIRTLPELVKADLKILKKESQVSKSGMRIIRILQRVAKSEMSIRGERRFDKYSQL